MRTSLSWVAIAAALAACSNSPTNADAAAPIDVGTAIDAATSPDAGYPPGPYGATVGSTLADFTVQGYALSRTSTDPTGMSVVPIRLSDVRATPGCTCLIVLFNAELMWCPPCNIAMPMFDTMLAVQMTTKAACPKAPHRGDGVLDVAGVDVKSRLTPTPSYSLNPLNFGQARKRDDQRVHHRKI